MTTETLTITLPPEVAAMLAQMAIATEQSACDLAASLLAEVLHDDALAHGKVELSILSEPAPVAQEPEPVAQQADPVDQRPDPVDGASGPVDAPPAPKRRGRPPGRAVEKLPKVRKKTAAEIRHEARARDPIVAEKEARELQKKVPLPAKRAEPRPAPPPAASVPITPKVLSIPTTGFTPAEDETIRMMRSLRAGPYDIARALKRDVNDVRKRIAELWVKK